MNQLNCKIARGMIDDAALGQLTDAERAALMSHAAVCAECGQHLRTAMQTVDILNKAPSIKSSPGFDAYLAAALRKERTMARVQTAATLAIVAHRMRRLSLSAAVYLLAIICIGYVVWLVAFPKRSIGPSPDAIGPHGVSIVAPQNNPAKLVAIDEVVMEKPWPVEDPYDARMPELEDIAADMPSPVLSPEPQVAMVEPRTLEELEQLPEPPARLINLHSAPSGSALARARFTTVKNARPHLRTAITQGLGWLADNQRPDGHWSAGDGASAGYTDIEVTATAALAFMECGFTPSGQDDNSLRLRKALMWMLRQKRVDGMFGEPGRRQIHAQAMVCAALSEATRLADRETFRRRFSSEIQDGVNALAGAQTISGAWGAEDTETTAIALLSMGASRAAGFQVPVQNLNAALAWLDGYQRSFETQGYASHEAGYRTGKGASYSSIAKVLMGSGAESDLRSSTQPSGEIGTSPVVWETGDFFRWYSATLAAYQLDGQAWQKWRDNVLVQLISNQDGGVRVRSIPRNRGSWEPAGACKGSGRVYATSMAVLTLSATCGHSPVYGGTK